ncbi:glucuronate isomerase [Flagellimonas nanhaiensis]|uniref:Uronate isomerase n=1 Tax=Flagellimonas nanhaiensis TaxID=2292706 RepID=A0A371JP70_9FLAO|nr:glucuronate isomerase [Allomuricauda nanhaiensis]RDY59305.1 glucuronate isomerase [Allomuricauda nanhaiensis]
MSFINKDFLLETSYATELYHDFASKMPIIDYHNHLSPEQIASNHKFKNLTEAWLDGDHYKWRAMRAFGVEEKYITGDASDIDKFVKWSETVPYTLRNPLYHWTHLELQRYFGIDEPLSGANAKRVFEAAGQKLSENTHSVQGLLSQMKVEVVCTTDDPTDSLEHHKKIREDKDNLKVLPSFRPDKAYAVEDNAAYKAYLEKLTDVTGIEITNYHDFIEALKNRIDFFHANGCRLSDHGLAQLYCFDQGEYDIEYIFKKILSVKDLTITEIQYFKFETLLHLCREYVGLGWVQQFHLGALRNVNKRMLKALGPDTGFDSIGDFDQAKNLGGFLSTLDLTNQLAKTVLYNLNPSYNEVFATMAGNFNGENVKGKVQFGSGWWYNDQLDGMEKQINALSNMGLLSCFVGMLTDSRSFLSFPRHEYFRRLLCNILGNDIKKGLLPNDIPLLGKIVQDISYNNAKDYFDFE